MHIRTDATNFNPRSPCGERRRAYKAHRTVNRFQSTLPVWGATLAWSHWKEFMGISIHAPRVGSDIWAATAIRLMSKFQSTLPVWGATHFAKNSHVWQKFQSTLPVWGATPLIVLLRIILRNFNPRSPCGERQAALSLRGGRPRISIHAPRVGSDIALPLRAVALI